VRASTRSKRLQQSQRFLSGPSTARAYAVGEVGPDPRRTWFLILTSAVVVALVSLVLYSVVVVPGVFLIWAIYVAVERSVCVVLTDGGMAVLARSEFTGRPRKFVGLLPSEALFDSNVQRSGRYVLLPTYRLWLRKKRYDSLVCALRASQPGDPEVPGTGMPQPLPMELVPAGAAPGAVPGTLGESKLLQAGYALPSARNVVPGWQMTGNRFNEQWYWDGREWTGHRHWVAGQWVEDVPHG